MKFCIRFFAFVLAFASSASAMAITICPTEPHNTCDSSMTKASLTIKSNGNWIAKWLKGNVATVGGIGSTDNIDVCVYRSANDLYFSGTTLLNTMDQEYWRAKTGKRIYKNREGLVVRKLVFKSGLAETGKIFAKGKLPDTVTLPLDTDGGVTLQFNRTDGGSLIECWEAHFTGDDEIPRDDEKKFKARLKP